MSRTRGRDTSPERALRSELHRRGLRFRVDRAVIPGTRRRVDVVFPRQKLAVLIDGCFWHGCPEHRTWPKSNADFWRQKIEANIARDHDTNERLEREGWTVLRFWEHENPVDAADRVQQAIAALAQPREAVAGQRTT